MLYGTPNGYVDVRALRIDSHTRKSSNYVIDKSNIIEKIRNYVNEFARLYMSFRRIIYYKLFD